MNSSHLNARLLWLAIPAGILAGACMTFQARINAALNGVTHDAFTTGAISFGSALMLLAIAMLLSRRARAGFARGVRAVRTREFPWWLTIGGIGGSFYVFTQGATVPILGIATFTVVFVAAQTFGSFIWDHIGLGPSGRHPFSGGRVIGAGLAVAAVAVTVGVSSGGIAATSWLVVLPLVAGIVQSWQQAANGRVRVMSESVLATTFWNFIVGTVAMGSVALVHQLLVGWTFGPGFEWWMLIGGTLGIVFIATAASIVRTVGVLALGMLATLGQLAAALLLELTLPGEALPELGTYLGMALALLAVGVMLLPGRAGYDRHAG